MPSSSSARDASKIRRFKESAITLVPASPAQCQRRERVISGRYHLVELLGQGAMGVVWRARDRTLGVDVAVKLLSISERSDAGHLVERFRFEAQIAAQLAKKTPHIVAVHDVGEDRQEGPYLVMEYVRGRTLRQLMDRGPMTPEQLAPLLEQIAEALATAHRSGIVHRDMKPSNVLLIDGPDRWPLAKVADFGIAKGTCERLSVDPPRRTALGVVLGTPAYMSPEQACCGPIDPGVDMWALAVIAHEAITGWRPFTGRSPGEVLASILAARDRRAALHPDLPPGLQSWFARAFALDATDRFPDVEQMVAAYRAAIRMPEAPPRWTRGAPVRVGKQGVALAGLLAAIVLTLSIATVEQRGGALAAPQAVRIARSAARAAANGPAHATAQPAVTPELSVREPAPPSTEPRLSRDMNASAGRPRETDSDTEPRPSRDMDESVRRPPETDSDKSTIF